MVLFWLALAGEGLFIVNVFWSYTRGEGVAPPSRKVSLPRTDASVKNVGWPRSSLKLFGIGAAFSSLPIVTVSL